MTTSDSKISKTTRSRTPRIFAPSASRLQRAIVLPAHVPLDWREYPIPRANLRGEPAADLEA